MIDELKKAFRRYYAGTPSHLSVAPGRVNIIGEHTDYNDGFVLPVALQYATHALARQRDDSLVQVRSMQYPNELEKFDLSEAIVPGELPWGNYVRGVAKEFLDAGLRLTGCDILLTSDVPQGCGLSSSAALEVAIGGLFNELGQHKLSNQEIAKIGQAAENNFIDCQCGIMDQLISADAQAGHALLIDCQDLSTQAISVPDSQVIMIINSNYPRKLADSEYNDRRSACEQAAKMMGVVSLRFADMGMLENVKDKLSDEVFRRAKHVIAENSRVISSIEALGSDDLSSFYKIMKEAHESLVEDFEITVDATEGLVNICLDATGGEAGVRQTGGGFGGAVVCVCDAAKVELVEKAVEHHYQEKYGLKADIYLCKASDGLNVTRV